MRRPAAAAAGLSAVVLASRLLPAPPLVDVASGLPPEGFRLEPPLGHLLTTPFSCLADLLTFNSARQWWAWGAWLLLGYWLLAPRSRRGLLLYPAYLAGLAAFLAWALLSGRPAARLRAADPDVLLIDFHSHTSFSWDGRRSFIPEANAAWHRDMGFSAGFITDHNRVDGALRARAASDASYRSLAGSEVSLHDAHLVLLDARPVDNRLYNANLGGIRRFLADARGRGPVILSLPEYWKHHWDRLETLAGWGVSGIEVVNASPKALDLPPRKLAAVLELSRRRGLFVVGISDNHGWSRASFVWNAMRLPGHAALAPEALERAVRAGLARGRSEAVRVIARTKRAPARGPMIALDPPLALWTMLRTLSAAQAAVLLAWAWGFWAAHLLHWRRRP